MIRIIILSCLIALIFCDQGPILPIFKPSKLIDLKGLNVGQKCLDNINHLITGCNKTVGERLINHGQIKIEFDSAIKNGSNPVKLIHLAHELHCCRLWDVRDCILTEEYACNQTEQESLQDAFEQPAAILYNSTCKDYRYQSGNCPSTQISEDCQGKTKDGKSSCHNKVAGEWKISKESNLTSMQMCCANWDYLDCVSELIKVNCSASDIQMNEYQAEITKLGESGQCQDYRYHSDSCKTSGSMNLVINTSIKCFVVFVVVFYRQNN